MLFTFLFLFFFAFHIFKWLHLKWFYKYICTFFNFPSWSAKPHIFTIWRLKKMFDDSWYFLLTLRIPPIAPFMLFTAFFPPFPGAGVQKG